MIRWTRGMSWLAAVAAVALIAAPVTAKKLPDAETGGRPLTAELLGSNEVPGPGDPDGSGFAVVTLNPGQEEVCFDIQVADVEPIAAAHIHRGGPNVAGPVVVNFNVAANGLSGCFTADRELIKEILKNPGDFYVNVHNPEFPPGALRGQLEK